MISLSLKLDSNFDRPGFGAAWSVIYQLIVADVLILKMILRITSIQFNTINTRFNVSNAYIGKGYLCHLDLTPPAPLYREAHV